MKDAKLIDVVNEEGKAIKELDSEVVHKNGLLHKAIHILVVDSLGRILVRKRSQSKKLYPGVLSSSVGAHILTQDTEDKTARKNLKTFLGLDLPLVKIGNARVKDKIENELITIYLCRSNTVLNLNPQESDEGNFMKLDEVKRLVKRQLTTPHLAAALKTYEAYLTSNNPAVGTAEGV
ncbi:MAG: hypothetical protein Q7R77_02780 [Candidatus Daviesbacteria bacterium]|nr:hypothetical protein [Candidatus Daviesbacteria bacterium]